MRPYSPAALAADYYPGDAVVISDLYKATAKANGLDPEAVYRIDKINPKTVAFSKPDGRTAKWGHAAFVKTDRPFVSDVVAITLTLGQVVRFDKDGVLYAVVKPGTTPNTYNIAAVENSGDRYWRSVSSARLTPVRITAHEDI